MRLAEYLKQQEHGPEHGPERIREMVVDDIRAAQERGDTDHVRTLLHILRHFVREHPESLPISGEKPEIT